MLRFNNTHIEGSNYEMEELVCYNMFNFNNKIINKFFLETKNLINNF